jgi:hypothetical protein
MSSSSTAAAELFQKSDEIVGHARVADMPRQSPTFLHLRPVQESASALTLSRLARICRWTLTDTRRLVVFGGFCYAGNAGEGIT